MRAMFANLTAADFRGRWKKEPRSVERQRVHVLFDEIQIESTTTTRARVGILMVELALATAKQGRAN